MPNSEAARPGNVEHAHARRRGRGKRLSRDDERGFAGARRDAGGDRRAAYLIPPPRVLGAILWTGYLGGVVATHVRIGDPLFSHPLFPVYVAALLWGGLCMRDARLRAILKGAR